MGRASSLRTDVGFMGHVHNGVTPRVSRPEMLMRQTNQRISINDEG